MIAGDLVWAIDTSGRLAARDLESGALVWETSLDVPALAGLAAAGDTIVVASYDGTVHAFGPARTPPRAPVAPATCAATPARGCCAAAPLDAGPLLAALVLLRLRRRRRQRAATRVTG